MSRLTRPQRIAVALWLVAGVIVWNGIFEMRVVRGVKEYLFRVALFEAGRGPRTEIAQVMNSAIDDALWIATLWASAILLAGLLTIRLAGGRDSS